MGMLGSSWWSSAFALQARMDFFFTVVVLCQCAIFWGELSKGRINKAKKSCEHLGFVGVYGVYCTLKIFYQPSGPYDTWCNHAMSLKLSLSHDGLEEPENSLLTKLTSSDLHRSMPCTPEGWFAAACRWTIKDGVFLAEKSFDSVDARITCWMGISGDMEFVWVKIWCISTWYMDGHFMGIWVMTMIEWLTYILYPLSSFKYVWFSHGPFGRLSN